MKKNAFKYVLSLVLVVSFVFCVASWEIFAKTLTNEDIQKMKNKQGGNSTYSNSSSSLGVPAIPPASGKSSSVSGGGAVIVKKHLPYGEWKEEYKQYFQEYYHDPKLNLNPKMIVLHYSSTDNFPQLWWTFVKGGQYDGKPGHLSVHYVVDRDGTIYELVPPEIKARGTYGVNHVAISIDLVGSGENTILNNQKQMKVSFALVKWLMKKYKIPKEKVLGHFEVARGRDIVPEYTDFVDKKYPDRYPPGSKSRGPGKAYMFKLRYYLVEPR